MKRLLRLEQQIGKYGERLVASPPASTRQNQWVVNEIRTMLDKKMAAHSSQPELTQHFSELFGGLEKIASPDSKTSEDPFSPSNSQAEIIEAFDEKYYKGQATFAFATKVLKDKRITDVEHFTRAIVQGGTILRSWTNSQRESYHLHIANKLWILGQRDAARAKLLTDYQQSWKQQLRSGTVPKSTLELLFRALIATHAVPLSEIVNDATENWQSLHIIWRLVYPRPMKAEVEDHSLLQALNHVSSLADNSNPKVPECLNFVASNAKNAPQQIRSALLHFAQDAKDRDLLDLLLITSTEGDDKIIEAGVIATKLALA